MTADKINQSDNSTKTLIQRKFKGKVVAKSDKTLVVKIDVLRRHALYNKRYRLSSKYQVHDLKNQYNIGDVVEFVGCRPISKNKKWRVVYSKS